MTSHQEPEKPKTAEPSRDSTLDQLLGIAPVRDDFEKIRQVATISANNDETTGALIADAMKKVGFEGGLGVVWCGYLRLQR